MDLKNKTRDISGCSPVFSTLSGITVHCRNYTEIYYESQSVFVKYENEWLSLAIQELHDWLQNVVSILGYAAGVPHVWGSLHLSQDVSHLLHVLFYVRLEASEEKHSESPCLCATPEWQGVFVPDSKDSAEIIHDVVELHLQVFQDVARLHTQLKHRHGKCLNAELWTINRAA